ncbi:tRNA (adenosine(37)-N6)-threonylcarbamoyltransferase complex dimerization subunit type 1 TsaB [Desulfuribacillus alkaliarsenatis]|uniref:tRNA (Adenosine(37)-N6)-threonylcarbamoyltransferase complex dimerization subunit type 1 TsaB n=1 Tax=Desulfuribacillus alkaliarsenatis TaxID=766136 RepID=A0A1E5G1Z6_9FIRM|nr:tRNA (adenosine(37)-N6)-threonylcarbamoyltransferase complex dimerization subunit type 1 TsaB [Desulfuribacillus alkaliarsenatis]OEF96964.1 tRNA (adenosine(37)-N6)-threonylcarbamoyltransferase complex dimerization subunit type 1 TsaB [Desulfuribacillus alkaliarsenatis]
MWYLAFDTSTQVLSVALGNDESVVAEYTTNIKRDHSSRLMPAIESLMKEANIATKDLSGIIVGKGPGSYTGLRIGVSTAKSMAWALKIPLAGVSSLSLIARTGKYFGGLIVPLIDARRGQVYTGLYGMQNEQWTSMEQDRIVLMKDWLEHLQANYTGYKLLFVSTDIELYREMIESAFDSEKYKIAKMASQYSRSGELLELGIPMLDNNQIQESKSFAPEYLRLAEAEHNWLKQQSKL